MRLTSYILPVPKQSSEGRTTSFKEDSLVAAFWWVGHTEVKADANMEMTTVTKKNVGIPALINIVDLKVGDKLQKYRAKEEKSCRASRQWCGCPCRCPTRGTC